MPLTKDQSDAMLRKALVDKAFRELLLTQPKEAAAEFGASLDQDECEKMRELRAEIESSAQALDAVIGEKIAISQLLPLHAI